MFAKTLADLREAVSDVRSDADRHMERISGSVESGTQLLTFTLLLVGVLAGAALLVAIIGISDGRD